MIVVMDADKATSDTHIMQFIANANLKDVVAHHTPAIMTQTTYRHSCKMINYILVSEDMLELNMYSIQRRAEYLRKSYLEDLAA